ERDAARHFFRFGLAIVRWAALDDVAHVDLVPTETHGCDHAIQKLTGFAHEGKPLRVFVGTGAFTHEAQPALPAASGKHGLGALPVQAAGGALADALG